MKASQSMVITSWFGSQ